MLNSECLEVFNKYLVEVKKCSTNTLSSYMRDVRQFGDYMQTHTAEDIVSATEDELSEYIDWLKGNGNCVARHCIAQMHVRGALRGRICQRKSNR